MTIRNWVSLNLYDLDNVQDKLYYLDNVLDELYDLDNVHDKLYDLDNVLNELYDLNNVPEFQYNFNFISVTRLPLRMSEKEVTMQTLIDRDLFDDEEFMVCNRCKPGADTRFVKKVHVMTSPKVWIIFGIFFCKLSSLFF